MHIYIPLWVDLKANVVKLRDALTLHLHSIMGGFESNPADLLDDVGFIFTFHYGWI